MALPTTAELDALESAYWSGALNVRHGDKLVTYRTADEMWEAIRRARRALGGTGTQVVVAEARRS